MTRYSRRGLNCSPLHAEVLHHLLLSQTAPCNPFSFIYSGLISLWPFALLSNRPETDKSLGTASALDDVNHRASGIFATRLTCRADALQRNLSLCSHGDPSPAFSPPCNFSEQTLPSPPRLQTETKGKYFTYFKHTFKSCFAPHPSIRFIFFRLSFKGKFLNVRVIPLKLLLQQFYCLSVVCIPLPTMLCGTITLLLRPFISLSLFPPPQWNCSQPPRARKKAAKPNSLPRCSSTILRRPRWVLVSWSLRLKHKPRKHRLVPTDCHEQDPSSGGWTYTGSMYGAQSQQEEFNLKGQFVIGGLRSDKELETLQEKRLI